MNTTHTSHITEEKILDRLLLPENIENPYPFYAHLRERSPVLIESTEGAADPWLLPSPCRYICLITGHAEAKQVLQDEDEQVFRHASDAELEARIRELHRWPTMARLAFRSIFATGEPRHSQLRRDLAPYFSPERMRVDSEQRCDEALDRIKRRLQDGDTIDLNSDFTEVVTINTIAEHLGVPESDRAALTQKLFKLMVGDTVVESVWDEGEKDIIGFLEYFGKLLEERRRNPRDDVASEVAHNNDVPDRGIDIDEPGMTKVKLLVELFRIGCIGLLHTTAGITNAMLRMLEHPDKASSLLNGTAAVKDFIAESFRYDTPSRATAPFRITSSDTMLGGVRVPAGTLGLVLLGAVNRDPAVFPDPDRFLPGRDTSQMMSFGPSGARSCIGRALTQMEMAVALPRLQAALPHLQLAGPVVRRPSLFTVQITRLPVSLAG